jgi:uncharacterized protein YlaN (UPF0358 family)
MAFSVVSQALGMIIELLVRIRDVQCLMMFMIVDTNNYDLLLGLDFLIKIGVVDVKKGLIQIK